MNAWLEHEHRLRLRAERVADLLRRMWGESPAQHFEDQIPLLIDAIAGDDEHGREDGFVVHGDGVSYRWLARAVHRLAEDRDVIGELPAPLRDQLLATATPDAPVTGRGMGRLPDDDSGAWEFRAADRIVSWDATCARLLGFGHQAGQGVLPTDLSSTVHPEDKDALATALRTALETGRGFEVRFRAPLPDGTYAWLVSRGRVLDHGDPAARRLIGFMAADD